MSQQAFHLWMLFVLAVYLPVMAISLWRLTRADGLIRKLKADGMMPMAAWLETKRRLNLDGMQRLLTIVTITVMAAIVFGLVELR